MNASVHAAGGTGLVSMSAGGFRTKATLGHGLKRMLETVDRLSVLTGPTGTTIVLDLLHKGLGEVPSPLRAI